MIEGKLARTFSIAARCAVPASSSATARSGAASGIVMPRKARDYRGNFRAYFRRFERHGGRVPAGRFDGLHAGGFLALSGFGQLERRHHLFVARGVGVNVFEQPLPKCAEMALRLPQLSGDAPRANGG